MSKSYFLKRETRSRDTGEVKVFIEIFGSEEKAKVIKEKIMATLHKINRGQKESVGYRIRCLYQHFRCPHNQ